MSDVAELEARIEGVMAAVKDTVKRQQQEALAGQVERHARLRRYEAVQARVLAVARPRLDALAKRVGERAVVTPTVTQTRRAVCLTCNTHKAGLSLTVSVAPDADVRNAVARADVGVVPVLWAFDAHAELALPLAGFDEAALGRWLDERVFGFAELYVRVNEGQLFDAADYVVDPVANVRFPRFAAGATLEHDGRTHHFVDTRTLAEFARRNRIPVG